MTTNNTRDFFWPSMHKNGRDITLSGTTFHNVPKDLKSETDPTLRVLLALLEELPPLIDDISAGMQDDAPRGTGNVITDANATLPTAAPADPILATRLAAVEHAVEGIRAWVGTLQTNYVEVLARVDLLEQSAKKKTEE